MEENEEEEEVASTPEKKKVGSPKILFHLQNMNQVVSVWKELLRPKKFKEFSTLDYIGELAQVKNKKKWTILMV